MTGSNRSKIQTSIVILLAVGFELASSLGLFLSLNYREVGRMKADFTQFSREEKQDQVRSSTQFDTPRHVETREVMTNHVEVGAGKIGLPKRTLAIVDKRAPGDVAVFAKESLAPELKAVCAIAALHDCYAEWCRAQSVPAFDRGELEELFLKLCELAHLSVIDQEGKKVVRGLRIAGHRSAMRSA